MGFLAVLLTAVFVTLKVTHVVAWSWLVVFSPLIAVVVLAIVFLAISGAILTSVLKGFTR